MQITLETLQNPKVVFCAIEHYMVRVGEDFIDQNESIVASNPFIIWLQGKGYITTEKANEMLSQTNYIQELLHGYGEGLFPENGETGDIARYKGYTLLAEYLATFHPFRERLLKILTDVGIADVLDESLTPKKEVDADNWLEPSGYYFYDHSPSDLYDYLVTVPIQDCDLQ